MDIPNTLKSQEAAEKYPEGFMKRHDMFMPETLYVLTEEAKPKVIGKVVRAAGNRWRWHHYVRATLPTTKKEPAVGASHVVGKKSAGIWAIRLSHQNATEGAAA